MVKNAAIGVVVVAENQYQRLALKDTAVLCGLNVVNTIAASQLTQAHIKQYQEVGLWLVDSIYDESSHVSHLLKSIENKQTSLVLFGFLQAPSNNQTQSYAKWQRQLVRKLAQLLQRPIPLPKRQDIPHEPWQFVVLLAASMGGPVAVKQFLDHLPETLPISLLLAQHFDANMLETLPRIITRHNKWQCQVVTSSRYLQTGMCLLLPIEHKVVCSTDGRLIMQSQGWQAKYSPSIDDVILNASDVFGSNLISIILSGMGSDGSANLVEVAANESIVWAQTPESSICASQPEAAIATGYCQLVGDPVTLAQQLQQVVEKKCRYLKFGASL